MLLWANPVSIPNGISISSAVLQTVPIYNAPPLSASKIAPSYEGSALPSDKWFLGLPESTAQTASRSVQPLVTYRQTDRPRYSVCNNRPHLRTSVALRCGLIKAKFHYAVQLASRSQTSARPNSTILSSSRPAREQVCDQLASWFASC